MSFDTQTVLDHARTKQNLTKTEERDLYQRIQRGDRSARDRLAEHNMRLAFKLSSKWLGSGLDRDDLVQIAMVGLMRAIDHFNPDRGRFSTCATIWIKKELYDTVYSQAHTIERPERISRTVAAIGRYVAEHPSASIDEISDAINRPLNEVRDSLDHGRVVGSTSDENYTEVGHEVTDEKIESVLDQLDHDEREAFRWRHGYYGEERSAEEISRMLTADTTIEGEFNARDARRLYQQAMKKLRAALHPEDAVVCSLDQD